MKQYTYRFADWTKCAVEISDELYQKLERLDKDEYNNWQRENRRHISSDELRDNGIDIPVFDAYDCGDVFQNLKNNELYDAVARFGMQRQRSGISLLWTCATSCRIRHRKLPARIGVNLNSG